MEQYETEEQQVEAIKRFWKENGLALVIGALLGLGGLLGWRYYNDSQIEAKEQASFAYEKASEDLLKGELGFSQAKTFIDSHNGTRYAMLMALELSQQAIVRKDLTEAAKQLEYVANNAKLSVHILLTKSDKLKRGAANSSLLLVNNELQRKELFASVQLFSSFNHEGKQEAIEQLNQWFYPDDIAS